MTIAGLQPWLIALVAVVMGWFATGILWNIRRGNAVLRWMQSGMPRLGAKTTLRWLGTSVVELSIAKARSPFREVRILLVMAPRDVPWLWILAALRGRRDTFILRGDLTTAPRLEYEISAPESWTGRRAIAAALAQRWEQVELEHHRFLAPRASLPVSRPGAEALLEAASKIHPNLWRLAVRRAYPQIELHVPLPRPSQHGSAEFFESVCSLAERIIKPAAA